MYVWETAELLHEGCNPKGRATRALKTHVADAFWCSSFCQTTRALLTTRYWVSNFQFMVDAVGCCQLPCNLARDGSKGVGGEPPPPILLTELVKSWLSWTIKNSQR